MAGYSYDLGKTRHAPPGEKESSRTLAFTPRMVVAALSLYSPDAPVRTPEPQAARVGQYDAAPCPLCFIVVNEDGGAAGTCP